MSGDAHGALACRELFARLSEFLDEELDDSLCERIEAHLEDCEPCVAFIDSLQATVEMIREQPAGSPLPPGLRRELVEAYHRLPNPDDS